MEGRDEFQFSRSQASKDPTGASKTSESAEETFLMDKGSRERDYLGKFH